MYCRECGKKIDDNSSKCGFCGHITDKRDKSVKKASAGLILIIILSSCLAVAGIILTIYSSLYARQYISLGILSTIMAIALPFVFLLLKQFLAFFQKLSADADKQIAMLDQFDQQTLNNLYTRQQLTSSRLTYKNYEKIHPEMTIAQATEILGEGKEVFSGKDSGYEIKTIMWQADLSSVYNPAVRHITSNLAISTMIKTITVKFKDGKAIEKSQVGL